MSHNPSDSAIRLNPDQEQHIAGLTSAVEIEQYLHRLSQEQGLTAPDRYSGELLPTERGLSAPRTVSKVLVINGVRHEISAENDSALQAKELDLYRALEQQQTTQQEQPRDQETGRFVSAEQQASDAAVEAYLRNRGIDPQDLQNVAGRGFQQRWSAASEAFRAKHPEYDRFASQETMERIGQKIFSLGLVDEPSAENLERAYTELVREGALTINSEAEFAAKIANAKDAAEVAQISAQHFGTPNSSIFSR